MTAEAPLLLAQALDARHCGCIRMIVGTPAERHLNPIADGGTIASTRWRMDASLVVVGGWLVRQVGSRRATRHCVSRNGGAHRATSGAVILGIATSLMQTSIWPVRAN